MTGVDILATEEVAVDYAFYHVEIHYVALAVYCHLTS